MKRKKTTKKNKLIRKIYIGLGFVIFVMKIHENMVLGKI